MMSKDEIQVVNGWFDITHEDRSYRTYRSDTEYTVADTDIREFTDFLADKFPDLVGIECMVGDGCIWFWDTSLEKAQFL